MSNPLRSRKFYLDAFLILERVTPPAIAQAAKPLIVQYLSGGVVHLDDELRAKGLGEQEIADLKSQLDEHAKTTG